MFEKELCLDDNRLSHGYKKTGDKKESDFFRPPVALDHPPVVGRKTPSM